MSNRFLDKISHVASTPLTQADVYRKYHQFLKDMNLQPSDVWVGHGSSLTMYGLKEHTNDIDAGCNEQTMALVMAKLHRKPLVFGIKDGYLEDNTVLLPIPEYDIDLHVERSRTPDQLEMVNGVNSHNLKTIMEQKQKLGRPKDLEAIRTIQDFIRSR